MDDNRSISHLKELEKHYVRLTVDDICDEGALMLAEEVLKGVREESADILARLVAEPNNFKVHHDYIVCLRFMKSKTYGALTMGNCEVPINNFVDRYEEITQPYWIRVSVLKPKEGSTVIARHKHGISLAHYEKGIFKTRKEGVYILEEVTHWMIPLNTMNSEEDVD